MYAPYPQDDLWSDSREERRVRRKKRRRRRRALTGLAVILSFVVIASIALLLPPLLTGGFGARTPGAPRQPASPMLTQENAASGESSETQRDQELSSIEIPDWIDQELLYLGGSRSGEPLEAVNDLAIHYVANPGTSAAGNRNYFNDPATEVNAHFLIGLDGEIIQCVPLDEKSAATNERNRDTISIEVCHPDEPGQFTDASYESLVRLCAWLCGELGLDETRLIRHYDVTGKLCPLYFVDHPEAWDAFRADVGAALAAP